MVATFAGEIPWCDTFPHNEFTTIDFVTGSVKVPVSPTDSRYTLRFVLDFGGLKKTLEPRKPPKFEEIDKIRKIVAYVPVRESRFSSGAGIERPNVVVPAKELSQYFALWPKLPKWDMYDWAGNQCTIATAEGGSFDYESHIFLKKELVDRLLSSQKLALVWVAWGERQHFSSSHAPSHGYQYFQQVYRYAGAGQVKSAR